jgi:putative inorganic carbon (HCO3(-)) transporter
MGFVFTIIYVVLTIISPEQFGPNWATYHALAYLAAVTALFSLPNIFARSSLKSAIQTYLLLAFIVAIGLSQIANHWMGGALKAWLTFLPSAAIYFFIVANVTTARRLKIVVLASVVSVFVLVGEGLYGYYGGGFLNDVFVMKFNYYSNEQLVEQIPRLRGVGFLHDPNDFAQMLLIALPLSFIAWRQGRAILNSVYVLVPTGVLLWATYLTHSRGALIGLAVLGLVAARRKLGTTASLALGVFLVIAMLTIDFTGGRALSAGEGGDRLEAWATGLELFKSAPVLGVGFGNFTDFNEITAHNSFVLALAELGLLGSTIWLALLVVTTMNLNRSIAQRESSTIGGEQGTETQTETSTSSDLSFDADQQPFSETPSVDRGDDARPADIELVGVLRPEDQPLTETLEYEGYEASEEALSSSVEFPPARGTTKVRPATEIEYESVHELVLPNHWMVIIRLALISFMTTSWFLSRTYASTTYLVLGLATAAVALDQSAAEEQGRDRWIFTTLAAEVLAIVFVYLVVRLRH